MENPVRWFEIYVSDMARAKTFYESVFNVKLTKMPFDDGEMYFFPGAEDSSSTPGAPGALVKMNGLEPSGISTVVYFASDDCSIEEGLVSKYGGKVHKQKMSIGEYGFISLAVDTEGNMFGIHSMK